MSTWLSSNRALSTRSLLPLETWDHFPLSPVCNPYCKPSAGNTGSSKLDVGTFRPNQYKPLCPPCTPSEPDAQIQNYSSVVRKHRHACSQFCHVIQIKTIVYVQNTFLPTVVETICMVEINSSFLPSSSSSYGHFRHVVARA